MISQCDMRQEPSGKECRYHHDNVSLRDGIQERAGKDTKISSVVTELPLDGASEDHLIAHRFQNDKQKDVQDVAQDRFL